MAWKIKVRILAIFLYTNCRKQSKLPYFDGSYLGNRLELEGKWVHFGKRICRAITYVKAKKIKKFLGDPPPTPFPLNWSQVSVSIPPKPYLDTTHTLGDSSIQGNRSRRLTSRDTIENVITISHSVKNTKFSPFVFKTLNQNLTHTKVPYGCWKPFVWVRMLIQSPKK